MLTEEALILLATLGASGLLVLGVVDLVWPATPRRPVRRARLTPSPRFDAAPIPAVGARDVAPAEPAREPASAIERAELAVAEVATSPVTPPVSEPSSPSIAEPPRAVEEAAPRAVSGAPEPARPQVLPIDTCLTLYKDRRFADVVSLGGAALEVHARLAAVSDRPDEASALVDLVGLSKQELGDRDGARAAFAAAVRGADPLVRPTYVRHLVTLVRGIVERPTVPADGDADIARMRELRASIVALRDALSVAPGDEALEAAQTTVRDALSPACERLVARVVSGEGDDEARTLVLEALADEAMPGAWRERLREQLASASSAEIGQLTAQAIRSVQDGKDGEALDSLERAERLAESLPSGAVTDERREEFERRLWWGYTKVGLRRVEVNRFEDALEPLFRALRLGGIDEERLGETRSALVRALDGLVDTRWPAIQKLGAEDVGAAQVQVEKLWALLRSSTERGIDQDDLSDAFAKVTHLGQTLSQPKS